MVAKYYFVFRNKEQDENRLCLLPEGSERELPGVGKGNGWSAGMDNIGGDGGLSTISYKKIKGKTKYWNFNYIIIWSIR